MSWLPLDHGLLWTLKYLLSVCCVAHVIRHPSSISLFLYCLPQGFYRSILNFKTVYYVPQWPYSIIKEQAIAFDASKIWLKNMTICLKLKCVTNNVQTTDVLSSIYRHILVECALGNSQPYHANVTLSDLCLHKRNRKKNCGLLKCLHVLA